MQGIIKAIFGLTKNELIGHNVYLGRTDVYTTIGVDDIVAYAAKAASIPQSDIIVTMDAMADAFDYFLCNGHSFKLDGIGTFSLGVSAATAEVDNEEAVTGADAVRSTRINFLPDPKMKALLSGVKVNVSAEDNGLVEYILPHPTSIKFGTKSLNVLMLDATLGMALKAGDVVAVKGYNLANGTIKIEGLGEEETIALKLTDIKGETLASGKASKAFEKIEKITVTCSGKSFVYELTGEPEEEQPEVPENPENPTMYTVTVQSANEEQGTVSGGGEYRKGSTITISAEAKSGFSFKEWNDGNTSATRQVVVNADKTYTASFKEQGHVIPPAEN